MSDQHTVEMVGFIQAIAEAATSEEADREGTEEMFGLPADEIAEMERDNWIHRARALILTPAVPRLARSNSDGAEMIRSERIRQVAEEGYDADHDDSHADAAILSVAEEILAHLDPRISSDPDDPWGLIARHSRREGSDLRLLTIAGALIAAEIDRRIRAGAEDATERARRLSG